MKRYIMKCLHLILLDVLFSTLYAICLAFIPLIIATLLTQGDQFDFSDGIYLGWQYLLVSLLGMFFQYLSQYFAWKWASQFTKCIKDDMMDALFNKDYLSFTKRNKEEYLSILSHDLSSLSDSYLTSIVDLMKSGVMLMVYLGFMITHLGLGVSSIMVICCLLALWIPQLTSDKLSCLKNEHMEALSKLHMVASDVLGGYVHTNTMTKPNILAYFKKHTSIASFKEFSMGKFKAFTIVTNGFLMYLLDILAFMLAAIMLVLKRYHLGQVSSAINYMKQFIWPIRYIINDINEINSVKSVAKKIKMIFSQPSASLKRVTDFQTIQFKHVNVNFPDFTITDLNFTFEKSKKYLLIGHSGSGKSTILHLLLKQIQPNKGEILIDHEDLRNTDPSLLISGVYRHHHLYQTSVYNNITLFETYSIDRLLQYLSTYPQAKIESLLKEKHTQNLSQGEQQIVELLRCFVMNTPVILLDEAMNSIDVSLRPYFLNMFLPSQQTLLMISHDVNIEMFSYFDQVLEMNNGHLQVLK